MGDSRISATGSEALPHHRAPHVIARGISDKEYIQHTHILCCVYRAPLPLLISCRAAELLHTLT
jgi:hypothetical protein